MRARFPVAADVHTTGESTPTIRLSNECLVVNASRAAVATVQLDLDDGSTTADVDDGFAAFTSLDGCTSVIQGVEPPQLLRDDEVSTIDADSVTALAPDGGAVVALSGTRHQLVRSADEDPVDLATGTVIIHFANR